MICIGDVIEERLVLRALVLRELLTRYGPIAEVWFDGANGEGPNGKRQIYDWPRFFGLVRRLQPNAIMFSDAGPDVRWCGNERGIAGDPNWSAVNPNVVTFPGQDGPGINDALQHGDRAGTVWRPAEVDVSIRPGWFYHPAEDDRVRTVDNLIDLYFSSVGKNGKLLLNVPPTRDGLLHATDVARLAAFRARLTAMLEHDVARSAERKRVPINGAADSVELDFGRTVSISLRTTSGKGTDSKGEAVRIKRNTSGGKRDGDVADLNRNYRRLGNLTPNSSSRSLGGNIALIEIDTLTRFIRCTHGLLGKKIIRAFESLARTSFVSSP